MKRQRFTFRAFFKDTSGTILLITGLAFLFLVGIAGAGYDLGRQQLVRQRIQQAGDAAALAAAGRDQGTTTADRYNTAFNVYSLNYPTTYFGIGRPAPTITIVPDVNVSVYGTTTMATSFVGNLGITTLTATGRSIAQIKTSYNKIDLIISMDNSNSMNANDVGAIASLDANSNSSMLNSLCFAEFTNPAQIAFYTGISGFYPHYELYCSYPYTGVNWGYYGPNRINALRYSADYVANALLNPNVHDNHIAIVKWDSILVGYKDFSGNYGDVHTELLTMFAGGATKSQIGLQKSLDLANSGFRGDAIHAIILLTDGGNNFPGTDNPASLAICNALKAKPRTLVFTVGFGGWAATDPTIRQFLSDCATGPNGSGNPKPNENIYFYSAPNAAQLQYAFDAIAGNLQKVRILQ